MYRAPGRQLHGITAERMEYRKWEATLHGKPNDGEVGDGTVNLKALRRRAMVETAIVSPLCVTALEVIGMTALQIPFSAARILVELPVAICLYYAVRYCLLERDAFRRAGVPVHKQERGN